MDNATKQAALSALRSLLVVAGTSLAARGIVTASNWNDIVGAVMVLAPVLWGIWDKFMSERKTTARETVAVQSGYAAAQAEVLPGPATAISPMTAQGIISAYAPGNNPNVPKE